MIDTFIKFLDSIESEPALAFLAIGTIIIILLIILAAIFFIIKISPWLLLLLPLLTWFSTLSYYIYKFWKDNK